MPIDSALPAMPPAKLSGAKASRTISSSTAGISRQQAAMTSTVRSRYPTVISGTRISLQRPALSRRTHSAISSASAPATPSGGTP